MKGKKGDSPTKRRSKKRQRYKMLVDKTSKEKTPNGTKGRVEKTPTGKKRSKVKNIDRGKTLKNKKVDWKKLPM
jgi:hypothetical protein